MKREKPERAAVTPANFAKEDKKSVEIGRSSKLLKNTQGETEDFELEMTEFQLALCHYKGKAKPLRKYPNIF